MKSLEDHILQFADRWEAGCLLMLAECVQAGELEGEYFASTLSPAGLRDELLALLKLRADCHPQVTDMEFALILRSCVRSFQFFRDRAKYELVWTGPISGSSALRRTEQTIVQLIEKAQKEIWLASYAFFPFLELRRALIAARKRGVQLSLLLEMAIEECGAGIREDRLGPLGEELGAAIYTWSEESRKSWNASRRGAMHTKFMLVDRERLLVTSANLTDAAMVANMELGIVICHTDLASGLAVHLTDLMRTGEIERLV